MARALTQCGAEDNGASVPLPSIILVMGVSGSGKSTVARLLAEALEIPALDGDDFHSPANVAKMARGEPLDDSDRAGWLASLRRVIDETIVNGHRAVLACSALKEAYRRTLGVGRPEIALVYLKADPEATRARLRARSGHFMKESMLDSQLATLEEPRDAIVIDAFAELGTSIPAILHALARRASVVGPLVG